MMSSILIVEDDITFGMMLKTWLGKKGFEVSSVSNIARARKHIESQNVDLVLSDLRLPDHEGIDLLEWMNEQGMDIPLIIMTGYADIQSAVQAMKLGARDYIAKPVNPEELLKKISECLQSGETPATHNTAKSSSKKGSSPSSKDSTENNRAYLEGESDAAKQLYNYVGLVAPTNMSVLINGSSGTGKEYVAHRIHQLSKRSDKPFIAVDCGSIPKELAASEFFGHVKGSFTGALTDKTGAFVAAGVLTGAFVTVGFLVFFGFGACVRFGAFVFLGLADLVGACDLDGFDVFFGLYEGFGVGAEVICGSFGAPVSVSLT